MRKVLFELCFVALVLVLACCSKQKLAQDKAEQLLGTWELRETQDGKAPVKEYPVGNGNGFRFSKKAYEQYTAGDSVKTGTYRVVYDTTTQKEIGLAFPAKQFDSRMVFDNNLAGPKTFFDFEAGKLILLSGFFPSDGGSRRVYERK